jgi:iron complex transport system substrate-binding protein
MRVVSLISSSTEMVYALGGESLLVGRSHECDYPACALLLPQLTRPAILIGSSSRAIDEQVKGRLRDALSIYEVDREPLRALAPDVILTQTQCEVCAVSLKDVERALAGELGFSPRIVSLNPIRLSDLWDDFTKVGKAIGIPAAPKIAELRARMEKIAERATTLPEPRVVVIEWIDPLMSAGNWMPELIAMAGGKNLFGEVGKHSPWMTAAELEASRPDVIVIAPCGFSIARTREEIDLVLRLPEVRATPAFKNGRIAVADGNQYLNRPGPRVVESLEILAEILHPEIFSFGHCGTGWERVSSWG